MYILPLLFAPTGFAGWYAASLGEALVVSAAFALAGLMLAVIGCKLFDDCTEEDRSEAVRGNRAVAATGWAALEGRRD